MRRSLTHLLVIALVIMLAGQAVAATHVVMPGDTLWLISQRYTTTVAELARLNNLTNANYIEVGQSLAVPGTVVPGAGVPQTRVHTVAPGETLWILSQRYNTTVAAIASANNITNLHVINVGDRLTIPGATAVTPPASPVSRSGRTISTAEFDLLARLVHAEAGGEPYKGLVAVAATVLNRVDSPRYPNTITAVIYQIANGYYQYSPVLDGRINLPATDMARRAVTEAIGGADPSLGALGFFNPRKTTNQWVRSQPVTIVIGNHVFFR